MKYLTLIAALFLLASFDGAETVLPSITVKALDGKNVNVADMDNSGKPMILCVWEISCTPSIREFDNISKIYSKWQEETGVKLIAISVDDNRNYSKVRPLVKSKGWKFDFYQDASQDSKRALGITSCPTTLILNGDKQIVWRKISYTQGDEAVMYEMLQKLNRGERIDN